MLRSPIAEESALQDRVETRNGAQRHQGTTVGWVFIRPRADVGKADSPAPYWQGFGGHAQQRTCAWVTSRVRTCFASCW